MMAAQSRQVERFEHHRMYIMDVNSKGNLYLRHVLPHQERQPLLSWKKAERARLCNFGQEVESSRAVEDRMIRFMPFEILDLCRKPAY